MKIVKIIFTINQEATMEKWIQIAIKVGGGLAALSAATLTPDREPDKQNGALILAGTTLLGSAAMDLVKLLGADEQPDRAV